MNARVAALLVGVNALGEPALIATVRLLLRAQKPALAVLGRRRALSPEGELQVAAVLVKRDASDDRARRRLQRVAAFGGR